MSELNKAVDRCAAERRTASGSKKNTLQSTGARPTSHPPCTDDLLRCHIPRLLLHAHDSDRYCKVSSLTAPHSWTTSSSPMHPTSNSAGNVRFEAIRRSKDSGAAMFSLGSSPCHFEPQPRVSNDPHDILPFHLTTALVRSNVRQKKIHACN